MNHQVASLQLNLGTCPLSNKLGIRPCLKQLAKVKIVSLASSNNPGIRKQPLKEIKVSLPQHLAQPVAK